MGFDNLLPFIVIIGALISFFGRIANEKKEQERKQQQRRQTPAQQQQSEQQVETNEQQIDWRDLFNTDEFEQKTSWPGAESAEPSKSQMQQVESEDRLEKEQKKQIERREKLEKRLKEIKQQTAKTRQQSAATESSGLNLQFDQLSNKEAMQGVVWAEVLGRPRAKQPHQTFGRGRRTR
ncbi:hypothetical protein [Bacillus sp. JCM 19034]|uniref:hypothetical protein n=1 Tax=Bacillus sp. JCM 19034 TaxID=1481928 RepID=UPI000783E10B|nr:hypothetical protein [Bacillus sp. JCM 19034]